jgi:shikimate dehydrogenase
MSPLIHAAFARQTGQDLEYGRILAPLNKFGEAVQSFRASGGRGANVTVPFKQEAFRFATQLSARAQDAEAVNTLTFDGETVLGDNTDGTGLVRDIIDNLGVSITGKRLLLMGAGGAARGVIRPLLERQPALLVVANRSVDKAESLQRHFGRIGASSYSDLAGQPFDLVINATSSGLNDKMPELPASVFATGALAYDMMYGRVTPFMQFSQLHGAQVADGLGMLVEQAAESFFIWRGVRPQTRPVIALLRQP